ANRVRAFMFKDRLPGCAVIVRPPDAAGGYADEVLALVMRVHGNRHHAAGDHRRADGAKLQAAESTAGHGIARLGTVFILILLGFFVVLLVLGGVLVFSGLVFVLGALVGLGHCRFICRLGLACG